jgi:uncharacterized membrane protein YkvA (DUF1232 family)
MSIGHKLRTWSHILKRDIVVLYYILKHPKTPWYAKILGVVVGGYALCPIDLIPDFVPVLGYLDDLILIPLGIAAVIKLTPIDVIEYCRQEAVKNPPTIKHNHYAAAFVIVLIWLVGIYGLYVALK